MTRITDVKRISNGAGFCVTDDERNSGSPLEARINGNLERGRDLGHDRKGAETLVLMLALALPLLAFGAYAIPRLPAWVVWAKGLIG